MPVRPAGKEGFAVIELDEQDINAIKQIHPNSMIGVPDFPKGLRLKVSEHETLTAKARASVQGGILEIK